MEKTRNPKGHFKNFSFNDLAISVSCERVLPLLWLKEFLCPAFELLNHTPRARHKVSLLIHPKEYTILAKKLRKKYFNRVDTFALDSRMIQLPMYKLNNARFILAEENAKILYDLETTNANIRILSPHEGVASRKALMRVVRELALNHCYKRGDVVIHGSAFAVKNKGFIIAGPKRAGKTTLLLSILKNARPRFVANDRVAVSFRKSRLIIRGIPSIVNLRRNTLNLFPDLKKNLILRNCNYHLSIKETRSNRSCTMKLNHSGTVSVSPRQLCHLLNVKLASAVNLSTIVFPQFSNQKGKIYAREISPEKAARRLMQCLFRSRAKRLHSSAFNHEPDFTQPDRVMLKNRCLDLTSRVRCVESYISIDSLKRKSKISKFIEFLLSRRTEARK